MNNEVVRFTERSAKSKMGRRVRSRVDFAGVPIGSTGRVVDTHEFASNQYDVVVEWDVSYDGKPVRDRFAKNTYEEHLFETESALSAGS